MNIEMNEFTLFSILDALYATKERGYICGSIMICMGLSLAVVGGTIIFVTVGKE